MFSFFFSSKRSFAALLRLSESIVNTKTTALTHYIPKFMQTLHARRAGLAYLWPFPVQVGQIAPFKYSLKRELQIYFGLNFVMCYFIFGWGEVWLQMVKTYFAAFALFFNGVRICTHHRVSVEYNLHQLGGSLSIK